MLSELSDLRLRLAELTSEKESIERERKREIEAEVERIHERYVWMDAHSLYVWTQLKNAVHAYFRPDDMHTAQSMPLNN